MEKDTGESLYATGCPTWVNGNIYPASDKKKKCRMELGKFCSSPSELAQQAYDINTVSTAHDAGCTVPADPGKASHYSG